MREPDASRAPARAPPRSPRARSPGWRPPARRRGWWTGVAARDLRTTGAYDRGPILSAPSAGVNCRPPGNARRHPARVRARRRSALRQPFRFAPIVAAAVIALSAAALALAADAASSPASAPAPAPAATAAAASATMPAGGRVERGALVMEGIPALPQALLDRVQPYLNTRTAPLFDWDSGGGLLIGTRL